MERLRRRSPSRFPLRARLLALAVLVAILTPTLAVSAPNGTSPAGAAAPAAGIAATPDGKGYVVAYGDGRVVAHGTARHHGHMFGQPLNRPIVGIVATASGNGYWLVAADGGVFTFGDAPFLGSTGAMRLNAPVVSLSPTPSGRGYWMVGADGGVFTFGDAPFLGSMGGVRLNAPVNGITRSPSGAGYRMVASDGGVFTFGDAPFYGSAGGSPIGSPVVAMSPTPANDGYWLLTGDGRVLPYGRASQMGQVTGRPAVDLTANPVAAGYRILLADGSTTGHGTAPGGTAPSPPAPGPVAPPTPSGRPDRLHLNFDSMRPAGFGSVTKQQLEAAAGSSLWYLSQGGHLSVVADGAGGNHLRQRYVPASNGTARVETTTKGLAGAEEMWLSYRLQFEPGWEWVKGGKLPGLAGGSGPTGGEAGDGTDGFSARLMWRPGGQLVVYAYHPDRPKSYGEDFPLSGTVPVGQWVQITQRVKMNSGPNTRDGAVEVWVNGQKRQSKTNLRWRTTGRFNVDALLYSSFYGGSDRSWAPSKTTYARFDDFKVSTTSHGVDF